MMENNQTKEK